jgi:leucyl-tRNA synthetase
VAILPQGKWPRGIFVNWYVMSKAGKISKSKGGAQPIPGAAGRYGVDSLRLYYAHIASPFADVEWDEEVIENYVAKVERVMRTVAELSVMEESEEIGAIDNWLLSRLNSRMASVVKGMEDLDLRNLAGEVYFEVPNDLKWYLRRGGSNGAVVGKALDMWVRAMAPITPHIAEELWEHLGKEGLVACARFPVADRSEISPQAELAEDHLRRLMDDVNEIIKVTKITPRRVLIYTTPQWKEEVMQKAIALFRSGDLKVPTLTKQVMQDEGIKRHGKEASDLARKMAEDLPRRSREEVDRMAVWFDELAYLREAERFLARELQCEVQVFSADDPEKVDPHNRSRAALPRRPAIYLE